MDQDRRDFIKNVSLLMAAASITSCGNGDQSKDTGGTADAKKAVPDGKARAATSLAGFALQFLTGLDLPFLGSDNNEDDFRKLNERLDYISGQLNQISSQLNEILTMLKNLPQAVRGIIQDQFLRQAVTDQGATIQLLKPLLRDRAAFLAPGNLAEIQKLTNNLAYEVNRIFLNTGGNAVANMTGFCLSCSGIATWAQSKTILLNIKELNPNGQTIWDQDFFQNIVTLIRNLFGGVESTDRTFKAEVENIPGSDGVIWDFARWGWANGNFKRLPMMSQLDINQFTTDKWRGGYSSPPKPWSECTLLSSRKSASGDGYRYVETSKPEEFADPATIRQANALWFGSIKPHIVEIENFYRTFRDYPDVKAAIYEKLVKPGSNGNKRTKFFVTDQSL